MKERIEELLKQVKTLEASNHEELEALRIKYLSKKGEISALFNDFRNVANEEKKEIGKLLNELKNAAQDRINEIRAGFEAKESKGDSLDLTRTADSIALGTGVGIRYDLSFLILRLDFGFALHVPYDTEKSGYYNIPKFKDGMGIHFAIGYPF